MKQNFFRKNNFTKFFWIVKYRLSLNFAKIFGAFILPPKKIEETEKKKNKSQIFVVSFYSIYMYMYICICILKIESLQNLIKITSLRLNMLEDSLPNKRFALSSRQQMMCVLVKIHYLTIIELQLPVINKTPHL